MTAPISIEAVVSEDRRLVVDLPLDVPIGPVKLVIHPLSAPPTNEREIFRAKLRAAGLLAEGPFAPPDAVPLTDDELEALNRHLPPGKKTVDEMLDEIREERAR